MFKQFTDVRASVRRADTSARWYFSLNGQHADKVRLSLIITADQWSGVVNGDDCLRDLSTIVLIGWEQWTMFRFETTGRSGISDHQVQSVTFKMPHGAIERVDQSIQAVLASIPEDDYDSHDVPIDPYWWDFYGFGKGSAELVASDEVRALISRWSGEKTFDRCLATLRQIALNTTRSRDDRAEFRIWRDLDGFTFSAGSLYGGIVNHGSDDCPDWSVHT